MKGSETRERICRAAMKLADRDGLLNLTIDNVAEEVGLSKGGVIHHFPSKDALLLAVIEYFAESIEQTTIKHVAEDPSPHFRWIRAMLHLGFQSPNHPDSIPSPHSPSPESQQDESLTPESMDRFMLSLLAVAVHNPELMKPIQSIGQRLRGRLTAIPEEGLEQLLMWLIADGLFLWRFVGLIQPNDPLLNQVAQLLHSRMSDATEARTQGKDHYQTFFRHALNESRSKLKGNPVVPRTKKPKRGS
jgi:AcrR family transcriptional regulator